MNFKPGTVVVRLAKTGPKFHFGIATERGTVIENQVGKGVQEIPYSEFETSNRVFPFEVPGAKRAGQEVIDRARAFIGQPYSLTFHCEHFVNLVVTDEAKSFQSDLIALLAMWLFDARPSTVRLLFEGKAPSNQKSNPTDVHEKATGNSPRPDFALKMRDYLQRVQQVEDAAQQKRKEKWSQFNRSLAATPPDQRWAEFQRLTAQTKEITDQASSAKREAYRRSFGRKK